MPELHIEQVFKLRNYPPVNVRVVVASTEGAIIGAAQTGGRMQVVMSAPKAIMLTAGVLPSSGQLRPELPLYVSRIIQEAGKSMGKSVCFPSRFGVSCTIEGRALTQEEVLRVLEGIGREFEQHVEHVELYKVEMGFPGAQITRKTGVMSR